MKYFATTINILICLCVSIVQTQFIEQCTFLPDNSHPRNTKIVGGETAGQGELGYQVHIHWYGDFVCGGTLIKVGPEDTQAVLTSASCVSGPDPFFYSIQVGDWNLESLQDEEQLREVDKIYFPENYNSSRPYENNIAIVTLTEPFQMNNMTVPISLPPQGQELNGNGTLLASGWGQFWPFIGKFTCKLQKVSLPLVDAETCQPNYGWLGIQFSESMFYVGEMGDGGDHGEVGQGPCELDFGGPLVNVEEGYLEGIMSFNHLCAHIGYPALSTRVSHYVDWIESTLNVTMQHNGK